MMFGKPPLHMNVKRMAISGRCMVGMVLEILGLNVFIVERRVANEKSGS